MLQEFLTGEVLFVDSLSLESGYDLAFGCDGSMVGSRNPAGILAVHSGLSDKDVVQGVVQNVPHVKDTCHIWWRDDNSIRFSFIRFRMKELVV